jgi:hypothetical protein
MIGIPSRRLSRAGKHAGGTIKTIVPAFVDFGERPSKPANISSNERKTPNSGSVLRKLFRSTCWKDKTTGVWNASAPGVLNSVTSLGDNWMEKVHQCPGPDETGWMRVDGLGRRDAEQLLDWLENRNISDTELIFDPAAGFTVRWRVPS